MLITFPNGLRIESTAIIAYQKSGTSKATTLYLQSGLQVSVTETPDEVDAILTRVSAGE